MVEEVGRTVHHKEDVVFPLLVFTSLFFEELRVDSLTNTQMAYLIRIFTTLLS